MNIKPIETHYKGYRFRSRLEARWAVFFDELGLKWEYEKEGFDLGGKYYLPDFWLPQVRMWAEVKGEEFTGEQKSLCLVLADRSQCGVLMLAETPDYKAYNFYDPVILDGQPSGIGAWENDCYLTTDYLDDDRFYTAVGEDEAGQRAWLQDDLTYTRAVKAARSARFEHGENAAPKRNTAFYYSGDGDEDLSGECQQCGRAIKPQFTLCWTCNRAYQSY